MFYFKTLIFLTRLERKAFIYIFVFSLIGLFPLIQANILYQDDIARVLSGQTVWEGLGRPLASFLMTIVQLGLPLTDISPATQMMALALYSLSSIYLGKILKIDSFLFLVLGGIIFTLNPFNIQIFSYVFDSFVYSVGLLFCTLSSLIIIHHVENRQHRYDFLNLNILISITLIVLALCIYQSTISLYLTTTTFYLLFCLVRNFKIIESLHNLLHFVVTLFSALIIYFPITKLYVKENYAISSSQMATLADLPQVLSNNFWFSLKYINESLLTHTLLSYLMVILLFTLFIFFCWYIYINLSKNNLKYKNLLPIICLVLFYLLGLVISFQGLNLILKNPVWQPRTFIGFTTFLPLVAMSLSHISIKYLNYFFISSSVIVLVFFANITMTYGNVLQDQALQDQIMITNLRYDLDQSIASLAISKYKLYMIGRSDLSPLSLKAFEKYPILVRTAEPALFNWDHNYLKLLGLGFKFDHMNNIYDQNLLDQANYFIVNHEPIIKRRSYNIYFDDNQDRFIIEFKSNP